MEMKMVSAFGLVVILVASASSSYSTVEAVTCQQGIASLMPCLSFLIGAAPRPSAPCCVAVNNLNKIANTTQARRTLCECFEKAAPAFGVKPEQAKQLPKLCGVQVPVPIDPKINCSSIPLFAGNFQGVEK